METETTEKSKPNLADSKKAFCDCIMGMTVKEYFDFMCMVFENMQIPVTETITEEMFYSCRQCDKEHGEECEKIGIDDLSKCYRFFCEHYGIFGQVSEDICIENLIAISNLDLQM